MTHLELACRRVFQMEHTLTKFRTRYYIRGEPERSSHRRHMAMLHQYFNLIDDVKRLVDDKKPKDHKPRMGLLGRPL